MAFSHSKDTIITLNAVDLSAFTTTSQIEKTADSHDVTTYGQTAHRKKGGLNDGTATMSGIFDSGTSNTPKLVIQPLIGSVVTLVRKPIGAGAGKPIDTVPVLVVKYTETSPVADMITWSADFETDGEIVFSTGT